MSKFFIPANNPEDWKSLLAKPDKHWRTGYSAKSLAYCWQGANGFPQSVRKVFRDSRIELFKNIELLLAFPEYKVPLPGGKRASQNDIFILAKGKNQLVSITVEGKVYEPFGDTISKWKSAKSKGKETRLKFLCDLLQLGKEQIDHIRYQLLHRTASAVIEAKRFNAENALMLVHSFSTEDEKDDETFKDYYEFLRLYAREGVIDSVVFAKEIQGVNLYFGWVREK